MKRRLLAAAVIAVLLGLAVLCEVALRAQPRQDPLGRELLYLPTREVLQLASLGNDGLAADVLYLWAIQYYSMYERDERFLYLETMFDLITDLDPLYFDAYSVGGMIMGIAASRQPERKSSLIALYDKGIDKMPEDFRLAEVAAWDFFTMFKDIETAVRYAEVAVSRPNAPNRILRVLGVWRDENRLWTFEESVQYWQEAASEATTVWEKNHCIGHLYDVYVKRDRERLDPILQTFAAVHGFCPSDWQVLIREGIIGSVPLDYVQNPYGINVESCSLQPWRNIRGH